MIFKNMKRIITIAFSAILTIAVSAQDCEAHFDLQVEERTPVEKIWESIQTITGYRQDSKLKVNHGDGVVRYVQNGMIGKEFLCSTDCEGVTTTFNNMTPEEIEAANERNRKVFDRIFGAIRHQLDSLMGISDESYHFESHSHGTDTIIYSLCLKNSADSVMKYKASDGSMIYPDATEVVSFRFTGGMKPCRKHTRGFGMLGYNKNVFLPNRQSYYFAKEPYLEKITPLLKQKVVKSWNFKWAQSDDYDIDSHWHDDYLSTMRVSRTTPDGRISNEGQLSGTMYFIPREKAEMAEAIFTAIDSTTLRYTEIHPEQMFKYYYNSKESVMQSGDSRLWELFEGHTGKSHVATHIYFGVSPQGYYVAVADTENTYCIPKEWYMLKSFVDGKKEYIKGAKKQSVP